MEIAEAIEFVRSHHHAVMHTYRSDGSPQLSPVLVGVDADDRLTVSTREPSMKVANLADDPRVSFCVLADGFFGKWVRVDGDAEIVHLPDAMDLLVEQYRSLSGEHEDWDDFRAAMERERRVLVRVRPTDAGPDRAG